MISLAKEANSDDSTNSIVNPPKGYRRQLALLATGKFRVSSISSKSISLDPGDVMSVACFVLEAHLQRASCYNSC